MACEYPKEALGAVPVPYMARVGRNHCILICWCSGVKAIKVDILDPHDDERADAGGEGGVLDPASPDAGDFAQVTRWIGFEVHREKTSGLP